MLLLARRVSVCARRLPPFVRQAGAKGAMARTESSGAAVVYVTAPSDTVASKLAHGLVESKLAACVNTIQGVKSVYMWHGKVEEETEQLLLIKTTDQQLAQLISWVRQEHPYDEPEVISMPITGGSASYLSWISESTRG